MVHAPADADTAATTKTTNAPPHQTKRRRRSRWGEAAPSAAANHQQKQQQPQPKDDAKAKALALQESIRQRLAALKQQPPPGGGAVLPTTTTTTLGKRAASSTSTTTTSDVSPPAAKKAKHYELDLSVTGPTFRRQADDDDDDDMASKQTTTTTILQAKKKKKLENPYLAHRRLSIDKEEEEEQEEDSAQQQQLQEQNNDERLSSRTSKPRPRHRPIHFVEPGTFVDIAERKRQKAWNAQESGFSSGRKVGKYVQSAGMATVYGGSGGDGMLADDRAELLSPRADADSAIVMPQVMEWWDVELLPSKLKKQVAAAEGRALSKQNRAKLQQLSKKQQQATTNNDNNNKQETSAASNEMTASSSFSQTTPEQQQQYYQQASLSYSKTASFIQHIVPIRTTEGRPPAQLLPVLHLTARERKRQRKLRRAEKQRELQDLQAAGILPPPEPRLTLKNFIQVLGQQVFVDPSQMEQKVVEQMQKRQQKHMARNEANRLTKEQRSEKRRKKLMEDTSEGVTVALFWVKDMSHPYHRAKVDLNAQQNNITGGVLECEHPAVACVICEGGPKAIKRYTRLMTVRMKWTGTGDEDAESDNDDEQEEEELAEGEERTTRKFNPDNKCELVWTGMGAKRLFKGFVFQSCETSDMARKVLAAKGVAHFWDQVLTHASGKGESFHLKLAAVDDEDQDEGDVEMEG